MSSSNPSSTPDENSKTIVVATEEERTMNSSEVTGGETTTDLNINNSDSGSHGVASLDVPPPSPSKSTGDSSNNSNGVTGGGITTDLNMPLCPSTLDSVTNLSNDENVSSSSHSVKFISKEICLFGIRITAEVAVDHDEDSPGNS